MGITPALAYKFLVLDIPNHSLHKEEAPLKEALMKNTTLIPSSIDSLSPNVSNDGQGLVRRSATMIGLAISMGATGLLFANQSQSALAAGPLSPDLTNNLQIPQNGESSQEGTSEVKFATPAFKHEVKAGETLGIIAERYGVSPQKIADLNNISPQAELLAGQSLKIPDLLTKRFSKVSSQEWESSLDNLRATRERLQESLAALRSEKNSPRTTPNTVVVTEVAANPEVEETSLEPQEAPKNVAISVEPASDVVAPVLGTTGESLPVQIAPNQAPEIDNLAVRQRQEPRIVIQEQQKPLYRVQLGDTLNNIARRYGISPHELAQANQIDDPNLIKINQDLVIPHQAQRPFEKKNTEETVGLPIISRPVTNDTRVAIVPSSQGFDIPVETPSSSPSTQKLRDEVANLQQVQTPSSSSTQKLKDEVANLQQVHQTESNFRQPTRERKNDLERTPNPEWKQPQIVGSASVNVENYNESLRIPVGATVEPEIPGLSNPNHYLPDTSPVFDGYIWPAKGVLTSGYGVRWGKMHKGIDIAGPIGTPIVAAADGEVVSAGWNSGGYGNLVKVRHPDGSLTLYAHNNRILVRTGERVTKGQQLSEMGSTGFSTGPHLHFEVHPQGGRAVNPIAFLPKSRFK